MLTAEPLQIVRKVADVLDSLRIPYMIGGSLASSLHGIPRATLDADLVIDLGPLCVEPLAAGLKNDFYLDEDAMREAVRNRSSFNRAVKSPLLVIIGKSHLSRAFDSSDGFDSPPLAEFMNRVHCDTPLLAAESFIIIHLGTMFKVDMFVSKNDDFSRNEMSRREKAGLEEEIGGDLFVASAEDTLLHKLSWFHAGGRISERQWKDALGILRIQGEKLDRIYLARMSDAVGVKDLLEKAYGEAESG